MKKSVESLIGDKKKVEIKKIFLYFCLSLFLTSCFQSTAMVGPVITLASTGNISHAGVTFFTNKAVEKETGMTATEYVTTILDENEERKKNKKLDEDLIFLVKTNFQKTRNKILLQNQSKISY